MTPIVSKIKALLAKTVENGATEAEALMAAQKAGELMDKYELTMSEIEVREESCEEDTVNVGNKKAHPVQYVAMTIGAFTDTRVWMGGPGKTIHFFGLKKDVQIATYLTQMLRRAIDSEWETYKNSALYQMDPNHGRSQRASFMNGMAGRLSKRLREMKQQREQAKPTGTSLVPVKNQIVEQEFKKLGMKLTSTTNRTSIRSSGAYHAGVAAGNRVNINPGVGTTTRRRIA